MSDSPQRRNRKRDQRFRQLAIQYLADELDGHQLIEFNHLLMSEASRCHELSAFAWQARMIAVQIAPELAFVGMKDPSAALVNSTASHIAQPSKISFFRILKQPQGRLSVSPRMIGWAASFLLMGYFMFLMGLVVWDRAHRAGWSGHQTLANGNSSGAILSEVYNCQWEGPSPARLREQLANRKLQLRQGLVELKFDQGATVVVEGPAEFEVRSSNSCFLEVGKLTVKVPRQAAGFLLSTPTAEVVDLGTEFGVIADGSGETEVQVFQGHVSIQSVQEVRPPTIVLGAGEAKRIATKASGKVVIENVSGPRRKLARELPKITSPVQQPTFPDSLVAYWNFDEDHGPAWDVRGANHGVLDHVERVPGLVGAGAVRFDNTNGQSMRVPARTGDLTFVEGLTIEVLFTSQWSGKSEDVDELFRKEDARGGVTFMFRSRLNKSWGAPGLCLEIITSAGPLIFDMPLDGQEGRPALTELTDSKFHHAAVTCDSVAGEFVIYVDGSKRMIRKMQPGISLAVGGDAAAYIGNYGHNLSEPFTGIIDEVAVYRAPLSAREIALHWERAQQKKGYFEN